MIDLPAAEGSVGTRTAAIAVFGGAEGKIGIEDIVDGILEELDETIGVDRDIGDGISADNQRGIVALGSGMLDEKQSRTHRLSMFLTNDVTIEESLEVIVAVVGNLGGIEDSVDIGHRTEMTGTSLVVDDANALLAADGIGNAVETVDITTSNAVAPRYLYALLEAENGKGRQATIGLDEQSHIADNDLAVDELQAVEIK